MVKPWSSKPEGLVNTYFVSVPLPYLAERAKRLFFLLISVRELFEMCFDV